ncbi:MAG: cyclic nucleotide-binding domain-containing protein [bacterium]|nr:cyclic nucleotide-binding domain-containing protein [bacterium]
MAERTAQNGPLHPFSDPGLTAEITRILGPHFMPRTFKPGALLWREGDTNGMLVSLAEGRVKIYRLMPDGNSVTNYIFGPGDVFGFMPLSMMLRILRSPRLSGAFARAS